MKLTVPHGVFSVAARGGGTRAPAPSISAIPTALRSAAVAPAGACARSTSIRNRAACTGRGSFTRPPAATRKAPVEPPGHVTRTSVGVRTGCAAGRRVSVVTRTGLGVLHWIQAGAPAPKSPIHAVAGSPSNAADARHCGWPWALLEEVA